MSFAKQLAKLTNLGILDHDGSLLGLRRGPTVVKRAGGEEEGILIVAGREF